MTEETTAQTSEETMLYRKPTDDSDPANVQEIWGQELETRTVNASDVPGLLADGWVTHPLDVGKKPEERAGFVPAHNAESEELRLTREAAGKAEALVKELSAELNESKAFLEAEANLRKTAESRVSELEAEIAALKASSPKK